MKDKNNTTSLQIFWLSFIGAYGQMFLIYDLTRIIFLIPLIIALISVGGKVDSSYRPYYGEIDDKPVIYLYGYDEKVTAKIDDTNVKLTCTYPKYNNGWNITAKSDGTLIDSNNKKYRYLYQEGEDTIDWDTSKGFCIEGNKTSEFLEEKLKYIGLSDEEINEFIIYWLPRMEQNNYNIISFHIEDYDKYIPLKVTPGPDSKLRVLMTWYPSDIKINIEEQKLNKFNRQERFL